MIWIFRQRCSISSLLHPLEESQEAGPSLAPHLLLVEVEVQAVLGLLPLLQESISQIWNTDFEYWVFDQWRFSYLGATCDCKCTDFGAGDVNKSNFWCRLSGKGFTPGPGESFSTRNVEKVYQTELFCKGPNGADCNTLWQSISSKSGEFWATPQSCKRSRNFATTLNLTSLF
jgi:hypothetical protein